MLEHLDASNILSVCFDIYLLIIFILFQFSIENMQTQTKTVSWQAHVLDLRDEWRPVCVDLPDNAKIRLWFTVIRNETTIYGVDMAIDDVRLNTYTCLGMQSP
jgi:hypothetical protein